MNRYYFDITQRTFSVSPLTKSVITIFGGIASLIAMGASGGKLSKEIQKSSEIWKKNPKIQKAVLDFLNSRSDIYITQEDPFNIPSDYYISNKDIAQYAYAYKDEKVRKAITEGRSIICAKFGTSEVLLHEYGHHVNTQKQDGSTRTGRISHSTRAAGEWVGVGALVASPILGYELTGNAAIPAGLTIASKAPELVSEFHASKYAYTKLKELGADPKVLNHVKKTLGLAFGTYLGAALFQIMLNLTSFYLSQSKGLGLIW